jgi:pimeloyl-ACP methyl ester carboxylesterase
MDSVALFARMKQIGDETPVEVNYDSEWDAYHAFYDSASGGAQFRLLAWIQKTANGKWAICPGVLKLFNMRNSQEFLNNILRPATVPLFAESMSIMEPKIIYRHLHVPMLILDPVSKEDMFPFEKQNAALQQQHPAYITHIIYENTGHNIHYQHPAQFIRDISTFLQKHCNVR